MANSPSGGGADGGIPDLESQEAFEHLRTNSETLLVDFYADWCGPCQLMADVVDELAAETDAPIATVNVETLPAVANHYDIRGIPAFVVFEAGEATDRLVGMQDKATLRELIEE
jgi:thioredoxin 1